MRYEIPWRDTVKSIVGQIKNSNKNVHFNGIDSTDKIRLTISYSSNNYVSVITENRHTSLFACVCVCDSPGVKTKFMIFNGQKMDQMVDQLHS